MKDIRFYADGKWLAVKTMKGLQLIDGSIPNEMKDEGVYD
jgi:hypothetical protein